MRHLTKQSLYQKIDEIRSLVPVVSTSMEDYSIQLQQIFPYLRIIPHGLDSKKVSGILMRGRSPQNDSVIILNTNRPELSQRFTLTHELIHYLLHTEINHFLCDDTDSSALEWQANEGAAELLVPYRSFLPTLKNIRSIYIATPSLAAERLAKQYTVSTTVIQNRLESLSWEIQQYFNGTPISQLQLISRTAAIKKSPFPRQPQRSCSLDIFCE